MHDTSLAPAALLMHELTHSLREAIFSLRAPRRGQGSPGGDELRDFGQPGFLNALILSPAELGLESPPSAANPYPLPTPSLLFPLSPCLPPYPLPLQHREARTQRNQRKRSVQASQTFVEHVQNTFFVSTFFERPSQTFVKHAYSLFADFAVSVPLHGVRCHNPTRPPLRPWRPFFIPRGPEVSRCPKS
jgi:hypothetical protein